jgi:hypothetical protein
MLTGNKYSVTVTPPNFGNKSPCKLAELRSTEVLLLFHPLSPFGKIKAGLDTQGDKMLMNDDYVGSELRDGMVLFLHIPTCERNRIDALLWDENMKMRRDLYPNWENTNEFRSFTTKLTSINKQRYQPKHITLDELIGSGKVCEWPDSHISLAETDELTQENFYIIRLTLYRKRWPWKWTTSLLDHIDTKWWYWTMGFIFITQNH